MLWGKKKIDLPTVPEGDHHPYRPLTAEYLEVIPPALTLVVRDNFNKQLLLIKPKPKKAPKIKPQKTYYPQKVSKLRLWFAWKKTKTLITLKVEAGEKEGTIYGDIEFAFLNKNKAIYIAEEICRRLRSEGLIANIRWEQWLIEWSLRPTE